MSSTPHRSLLASAKDFTIDSPALLVSFNAPCSASEWRWSHKISGGRTGCGNAAPSERRWSADHRRSASQGPHNAPSVLHFFATKGSKSSPRLVRALPVSAPIRVEATRRDPSGSLKRLQIPLPCLCLEVVRHSGPGWGFRLAD